MDRECLVEDIRKGPWTVDEDALLSKYITENGEGRWNTVACSAGLKRTGKSCRLRWLNYLRPDVRRGNISLQEQLMILELHSLWGNRWSKIAQYLPGRTDNEIKNYWRTRVQKLAKNLNCDVNSKLFRDTMRNVWIPRLVERINASTRPRTRPSSPGQPVSAAGQTPDLRLATHSNSNSWSATSDVTYNESVGVSDQRVITSASNDEPSLWDAWLNFDGDDGPFWGDDY